MFIFNFNSFNAYFAFIFFKTDFSIENLCEFVKNKSYHIIWFYNNRTYRYQGGFVNKILNHWWKFLLTKFTSVSGVISVSIIVVIIILFHNSLHYLTSCALYWTTCIETYNEMIPNFKDLLIDWYTFQYFIHSNSKIYLYRWIASKYHRPFVHFGSSFRLSIAMLENFDWLVLGLSWNENKLVFLIYRLSNGLDMADYQLQIIFHFILTQ